MPARLLTWRRNGANLKLADERGETALGLALKLGQKDIATP